MPEKLMLDPCIVVDEIEWHDLQKMRFAAGGRPADLEVEQERIGAGKQPCEAVVGGQNTSFVGVVVGLPDRKLLVAEETRKQ